MITNLFSVFDPSSFFSLPLNWISTFAFIILITPRFWIIQNKISFALILIFKKLNQEFKILTNSSNRRNTILFISLFTLIIFNNVIGLIPYVFTSTRHLTITLSLRIPLWLSFIIYGWFNHMKHIFAHLVPQRTPNILIPFMVLIESIRNIIRPLTLAVRLMANIVAGHLLITLLGNQTASARNIVLISLISTQILLLTLESAVAFIQSYVFAVLSTLYSSEVQPH